MIIEKGKTSNGYAKEIIIYNNASFDGGRYFFVIIIKTINVIKYIKSS